MPSRLLAALLLLAPFLSAAPSLEKIVVIGASVSRGFTKTEPLGGEKSSQLRLDRYLAAALAAPHGRIINDSNQLFFIAPEKEAALQIGRVGHREPTLVVAVDFLFWFLYGHPGLIGDRLEFFERGLDFLARIDAPLVVGDIPDASTAVHRMLRPDMIPTAAICAEANRRLARWAAKRGDVAIVPLADFLTAVESDSQIKTGPTLWPAGTTGGFLQDDRLHPTPRGCAALSLAIMESLLKLGLPDEAVSWTPAALLNPSD